MFSSKSPSVIPSPLSRSTKLRWITQHWKVLGILASSLALVFVSLVGFYSAQLLFAIRSGDTHAMQRTASRLLPLANLVAPTALGDAFVLSPVRLTPQVVLQGSELSQQIHSTLEQQQSTGQANFRPLLDAAQPLQQSLQGLQRYLQQHPRLASQLERRYPKAREHLTTATTALQSATGILQTNGRWLIVLQNTDELRATGGFMGSYIVLTLENGKLLEWVVEDIYDADGQFTGFIAAPPGAKEYLSSDRGLRLPDANWNPDFPSSAQQILQFFALGERPDIKGVAAINLTLAEQILAVLGPLSLPDYDTLITSDTIATALRSERQEFFAGSISKKHLLKQLFVQLQVQLSELPPDIYAILAQQLWDAVQTKDLQLYAIDPILHKQFEQLDATGAIEVAPHTTPLMLVESNVGINKANRKVDRTIVISHQQKEIQVAVTFANHNLPVASSDLGLLASSDNQTSIGATHNGYISYLRLLTAPGWQLTSVQVDGQPTPIESERMTATYAGAELVEYGTLVRIPEQTEQTIVFVLNTTQPELAEYPIDFIRQAGIPEDQIEVRIE